MRNRFGLRSTMLWVAAVLALAAALWAAVPGKTPAMNLAADLPPGALMTVESADFASLLHAWTHSAEEKAWMRSASFSAFANSRLFSRLTDAQSGFASAAHTDVGSSFLHQVAGKESIFAWYDVGNLEFLYITHLSREQVSALSLLQQRARFTRREAAGTAFYVRTGSAGQDEADTDAASTEATPEVTEPRTVAFAVRGEWLLLATREDLIANALQLMTAADATGRSGADSEASVGWYAGASAAAPTQRGDLHMLLDLQSLTKTPQFRTYWIQQNVTDTRRFRAATVDLYREPGQFREERVLLPVEPPAAEDSVDLGEMEALVPERVGVYRAVARPSAEVILQALEDKVLPHGTIAAPNTAQTAPAAPDAFVAGSASDLDVRIDAAPRTASSPEQAMAPLRALLGASEVRSMLSMDRSEPASAGDPFLSIHSAVVLRATTAWDVQRLTAALNAALQPQLTTASLGLTWKPVTTRGGSYFALSGAQPMVLYVDGSLALLSNDPVLVTELMLRRERKTPPEPALMLGAVQPGMERGNFRRFTAQLAQGSGPVPVEVGVADGGPAAVQLFRDNLPSLADAFSSLEAEHIVVRADGPLVRHTVVYRWIGPSSRR